MKEKDIGRIVEIDYENRFSCKYQIKEDFDIIEYKFYYQGREIYYLTKKDAILVSTYENSDLIDRNCNIKLNRTLQIKNTKESLEYIRNFSEFDNLYEFTPFICPECLYNILSKRYIPSLNSWSLLYILKYGSEGYKESDIIDKINSTEWILTKVNKSIINIPDFEIISGKIEIFSIFPNKENEEYMKVIENDEWTDGDLYRKFIELLMKY